MHVIDVFNMSANIIIQPFVEKHGNEVTHLFRNHHVSNKKIIAKSLKAPAFYVIAACIACLLIFLIDNLLIILVLSIFMSWSLIIVITKSVLWHQRRFNGEVYPKTLKENEGMFFVALDTGNNVNKVVGTIAIEPFGQKMAMLILFCVHKNYRGNGIGRRLLCKAIEFSEEAGLETLCADMLEIGSTFSVSGMFERRQFHLKSQNFAFSQYLPMFPVDHYERRFSKKVPQEDTPF